MHMHNVIDHRLRRPSVCRFIETHPIESVAYCPAAVGQHRTPNRNRGHWARHLDKGGDVQAAVADALSGHLDAGSEPWRELQILDHAGLRVVTAGTAWATSSSRRATSDSAGAAPQ